MVKRINERWISLLMWPSMVLLTCFLGIYLYKAYQTEKKNLNKEVGYLFVNAVNTMEGSLINQLVFRKDSFNRTIKFRSNLQADSVKVVVVDARSEANHPLHSGSSAQLESFTVNQNRQSGEKVFIQRKISEEKRTLQQAEGVISLIFRHDIDSTSPDSSHHRWTVMSNLKDSIKEKFDLNLDKAGLAIHYTLNQYKDTSDQDLPQGSLAGSYHDLASGDKYEVRLASMRWVILLKLWPEIILALLLLLCLGLAFYSMSTTIRTEKKLLDAKSDFIQNMTHELKTPISTVRVALEALQEFEGFNDVQKREDYLRISQNELDRLSVLVDRVLSMSRIDRAMPAAQKEIINIAELVGHIIDTLKVQAEKQNIRIIIHQSDPDISLYADPQWVSGIVYNLLDNAIKYSDKDEPCIDVSLQKNKEWVELTVKDNGPGIGRDHQTKIFEKFYRIPQGNVHTVKGHGLGLAFVWRIVKEMEGKISIDSEPGKGSTFNVCLPAA